MSKQNVWNSAKGDFELVDVERGIMSEYVRLYNLKWLTNLYDAKREDAKMLVHWSLHETPAEALERQVEWLKGKVIGDPQATEAYTVEQLKEMGYVGVYLSPVEA